MEQRNGLILKSEKELTQVKVQLGTLEAKNQELLEQLQEGERVRAELSMVVWQKEERIKALQANIDSYEKKVISLMETVEGSKKKLEDKEEFVHTLEEKVRSLQEMIRVLEGKIRDLEKILNQYPVKITMKIKDSLSKLLPFSKK